MLFQTRLFILSCFVLLVNGLWAGLDDFSLESQVNIDFRFVPVGDSVSTTVHGSPFEVCGGSRDIVITYVAPIDTPNNTTDSLTVGTGVQGREINHNGATPQQTRRQVIWDGSEDDGDDLFTVNPTGLGGLQSLPEVAILLNLREVDIPFTFTVELYTDSDNWGFFDTSATTAGTYSLPISSFTAGGSGNLNPNSLGAVR